MGHREAPRSIDPADPADSADAEPVERLIVLPDGEALREIELRNPELFELAPDIVYSHDLEGRFIALNQAVERITGYPRSELIGNNFGGVVAPEYRELAGQMIRRKLAGEKLTVYELEIVAKDGHRVPLEVSTWLVYRDGNAIGVQGIARDITDRRAAESLAQDSERRFRSLIENSSDAIMLWSSKGRIQYATPSVERVLGYTEPELAGRMALELVHPDDVDQARRLWTDVNRAPGALAGGLFRVQHRDGSWLWIEGIAKNLTAEAGVAAIVATFRDVSERVRTQQELQDSVRLLESAYADRRALMARLVNAQEEERERIAQDIHDDSIQSLTASLMSLETLRNHLDGERELEMCDRIIGSVRHSISSLRALIFEVHPHALDEYGLEPAIRQLLERARHQTGLEFDVRGNLDGDPSSETRQVVFRIAQEALMNVLKHARARRVEVTLEPVDAGCRVEIRDDGVGFPAERGTEMAPGHLGLAGMRARAHSAGGWCRVESRPGEGTAVEYWIPNQPPSERPVFAQPAAE